MKSKELKEKLIKELDENSNKLEKLKSFIKSENFNKDVIDISHRVLLIQQREIMQEYVDILNKRIELLN